VPAIIRFVLKETHSKQVHFLGHSMVSSACVVVCSLCCVMLLKLWRDVLCHISALRCTSWGTAW
jgi:ascorbate-specific PTS system EIIC-type component UlaA